MITANEVEDGKGKWNVVRTIDINNPYTLVRNSRRMKYFGNLGNMGKNNIKIEHKETGSEVVG
jgi:hypothetical protein